MNLLEIKMNESSLNTPVYDKHLHHMVITNLSRFIITYFTVDTVMVM